MSANTGGSWNQNIFTISTTQSPQSMTVAQGATPQATFIPSVETSGGGSNGGGGNNTVRIAILEVDMAHIKGSINTLGIDLKEVRWATMGLAGAGFILIGGLYLYINSSTGGLSEKIAETDKNIALIQQNVSGIDKQLTSQERVLSNIESFMGDILNDKQQ